MTDFAPTLVTALNKAQVSSSALQSSTSELKHILFANPELYTCPGGLAEKGSLFFLHGATRKGEAGAKRLYQLFSSLLLPGVVGEIPTGDSATPSTAKAVAAVVSSAQKCLASLLGFGGAADKNVRLHVCNLAHACINLANSPAAGSATSTAAAGAAPEAELSDEAWSCLRDCLLPRLKDKHASVRAGAASALVILQDDDPDGASGERDDVTLELLRLSGGDSAKEVRAAATASFQLSKGTLPTLLQRTRDVSPSVREAALLRLGKDVNPEFLTGPQRGALMSRSLADRDPQVCARGKWVLLHCWLRKWCDCDPCKLLGLLLLDGGQAQADSREGGADPATLAAMVLLQAADNSYKGGGKDDDCDVDWSLSPESLYKLEQKLTSQSTSFKAGAQLASKALAELKHATAASNKANRELDRELDDDDAADGQRKSCARLSLAKDDAEEFMAAAEAAVEGAEANLPTASSFLLTRTRVEWCHRTLKGARKEEALEALLPDTASFADLLELCLSNASKSASSSTRLNGELDEVLAEVSAYGDGDGQGSNGQGVSPTSPLATAAESAAKKADKKAAKHLAAALQALRTVPVLDRQDEAGRQALGRGLGGAILDEGMSEAVVCAAVEALASVHFKDHNSHRGGGGGGGLQQQRCDGEYPTALLGLVSECRRQANAFDGAAKNDAADEEEEDEDAAATAAASGGDDGEVMTPPPPSETTMLDDGLSAEDKEFLKMLWECRLGLIASEGLKHAKPHSQSSPAAGMGCGGVLCSEFERHLSFLLTSSTTPCEEAREYAVKGLARLALLDEQTAARVLPVLVSVSLMEEQVQEEDCCQEGPEGEGHVGESFAVRAAALQGVVDLCLVFDRAATQLCSGAETMAHLPAVSNWASARQLAAPPSSLRAPSSEASSGNFLVELLVHSLGKDVCGGDDSNGRVMEAALMGESAAKLLAAQRITPAAAGQTLTSKQEKELIGGLLDAMLCAFFRSGNNNGSAGGGEDEGGEDEREGNESGATTTTMTQAKAVGSTSRTQQVLSVFFDTFAKGQLANQSAASQQQQRKCHHQCLTLALQSFLKTYSAAAVLATSRAHAAKTDQEAVQEKEWSPLGGVPPSQPCLFLVSLLDAAEDEVDHDDQEKEGGTATASPVASPSSATVTPVDDDDGNSCMGQPQSTTTTPTTATKMIAGQGRADTAFLLCHLLTTFAPPPPSSSSSLLSKQRTKASSTSTSAVSQARVSLAKALGSLPVPGGDGDRLKLVGSWAERAADAVASFEGEKFAKPIRKFVEACKAADPDPSTPLPPELHANKTKDYLRVHASSAHTGQAGDGENGQEAAALEALLAAAPLHAEPPQSKAPKRRASAAGSKKRQSLKEVDASEEEEEDAGGGSEEDEEDDEPCVVCGLTGHDEETVLCDGCDKPHHLFCLNPPLAAIPEGDWHCPSCCGASPPSELLSETAVHAADENDIENTENDMGTPNTMNKSDSPLTSKSTAKSSSGTREKNDKEPAPGARAERRALESA